LISPGKPGSIISRGNGIKLPAPEKEKPVRRIEEE